MATPWPAELQQLLLQDGFSYNIGDQKLTSSVDVGPNKIRRTSTRSIDSLAGAIFLTVEQYAIFRTFYDTTINGGITPFTATHPIKFIPADFRFVGNPTINNVGGIFSLRMTWEELP